MAKSERGNPDGERSGTGCRYELNRRLRPPTSSSPPKGRLRNTDRDAQKRCLRCDRSLFNSRRVQGFGASRDDMFRIGGSGGGRSPGLPKKSKKYFPPPPPTFNFFHLLSRPFPREGNNFHKDRANFTVLPSSAR